MTKKILKLSKNEIRMNSLLELLNKYKVLSIVEASDTLDVSTMTIRRDCHELEKQNKIRLRNGIIFLGDNNNLTPIKKTYELVKETSIQNSAKIAIGKYAASLIEDGETIIIDTGSTTENVVPFIDENIRLNLFCSNLNILNQAVEKENIDIIFSGGNYHSNTQMFESKQSIDTISSLRANKVFLSAAGVHEKLGLTCMNAYEVATKQAIIDSADKHILLVDSSKFEKICTSYFADLSKIDTIITDKGIDKQWIEKLNNMKIELHLV